MDSLRIDPTDIAIIITILCFGLFSIFRGFVKEFFSTIGWVAAVILAIYLTPLISLKIDDVVGAIPVHGFAGIFGTLVVPISNSAASFGAQLYGIIAINVFVFVVSFIIWYIMKMLFGIRISEEAEKLGTDKSEVGVMAYSIRD